MSYSLKMSSQLVTLKNRTLEYNTSIIHTITIPLSSNIHTLTITESLIKFDHINLAVLNKE